MLGLHLQMSNHLPLSPNQALLRPYLITQAHITLGQEQGHRVTHVHLGSSRVHGLAARTKGVSLAEARVDYKERERHVPLARALGIA